MEKRDKLSFKEKKLLQYIGRNANLTNEEFSNLLGYKYPQYISTVKRRLRKMEYLTGPFHYVDYGRICKNRLNRIMAIVMFKKPYDFVVDVLTKIDSYLWIYPIEERLFNMVIVSILNTNFEGVKKIFEYLKKMDVIHYYEFYIHEGKWYLENPTFLINGKDTPQIPELKNLLEDVKIPDLRYGKFEGIKLNKVDTVLTMDLEVGIENCNLKKIMNFEYKNFGNFFTYDEVKKSYKKLLENNIVQKYYNVYPLPMPQCSRFILMVRSDSFEDIKKIVFNFGKNSRIRRRLTYWISPDEKKIFGVIQCFCNPQFTLKLMKELHKYEEIKEKKFLTLRSFPVTYWKSQSISLEYYDEETQTLYFPYDEFLERIKKKVEG